MNPHIGTSGSVSNLAAVLAFTLLLATAGVIYSEPVTNSVPDPLRARNACLNNLRQIDAAKQQWALENRKQDADIPTTAEVAAYLKNNRFPVCPLRGKYTLNRADQSPTCSIPGHKLETP